MRTFSLNEVDIERCFKIWKKIRENEGYFKKFNGGNYDEAMCKVYLIATKHYDECKGELLPYIKKLARDILWSNVNQKEQVYDIYTEDGELASIYTVLRENIDERVLYKEEELKNKLGDLYLLDKKAFKELELIYKVDTVKDIKSIVKIKNEEFKEEFKGIVRVYGSELVFKVLYKYIQENVKEEIENIKFEEENRGKIKKVNMRVLEYEYLSNIPTGEIIKDKEGKVYSIDKYKYIVEGIDLDRQKWESVLSPKGVYKIDISPLLDYMYREIYVEEGVDTEYIKWRGCRYMLISLGGERYRHNMDREKFIKLVRLELLSNLIYNKVGTIVGLTEDSVYIKYTRAIKYRTIRLLLSKEKHFDLKIEYIGK